MTFYERCEGDTHVQNLLMQSLVREHGPNVVSIELNMTSELSPRPPDDLDWWFEPARQEFEKSVTSLDPLNICDNLKAECEEWAASGECMSEDDSRFMTQYCQKSCNRCSDMRNVQVGSEIVVYVEYEEYLATVKQMTENPTRFLLDYGDDYSIEEGRYEWLDKAQLRERMFYFVEPESEREGAGEYEEVVVASDDEL